jgi:predicted AAA+ superfamily ATPase
MKELFLEDFSKIHKEKRNAYSVINDYIHSEECYDGTVFAIHGLRRTGKTTIMEQLMLDNKDSIGCMFLLAEEKDKMDFQGRKEIVLWIKII